MTHPIRTRFAALLGLAAATALLVIAGTTLPAAPAGPGDIIEWWTSTDPTLAVGVLLHAGALAVCAYLLVITTIELAGTLLGLRPIARVARRLAPVAWRTIVLRPVTLGTLAVPTLFAPALTAAPAMAQPAAADTNPAGDHVAGTDTEVVVVTMSRRSSTRVADPAALAPHSPRQIDDEDRPEEREGESTEVAGPAVDHSAAEGSHRPAPVSAGATPTAPPPTATLRFLGPTSSRTTAAPVEVQASSVTIHRTMPGDTLWRIADDHLRAAFGRTPGVRETSGYVDALVAANRDRLPMPGNPDLIYPGIELLLPAVG